MAAKAVLTSEDLERIQSATGKTFELVRGELYEVVPPNPRHGGVALLIAFLLETWNRLSNTGWVITESGFTLQHQPNAVRGPDVSFVSRERMRGHEMGRGFPSTAPDLVVEIRSPDDFWTELQDKAREYLAAGSRLVWLVEMDQFVEVWSPGEPARRLAVGDELRAEVVLPGFSCRVADFFPPTA